MLSLGSRQGLLFDGTDRQLLEVMYTLRRVHHGVHFAATRLSELVVEQDLEFGCSVQHGLLLGGNFVFVLVENPETGLFLLPVRHLLVVLLNLDPVGALLVYNYLVLTVHVQLVATLHRVIFGLRAVILAPVDDCLICLLHARVMIILVALRLLSRTLIKRVLNHLGLVDARRPLKVVGLRL